MFGFALADSGSGGFGHPIFVSIVLWRRIDLRLILIKIFLQLFGRVFAFPKFGELIGDFGLFQSIYGFV